MARHPPHRVLAAESVRPGPERAGLRRAALPPVGRAHADLRHARRGQSRPRLVLHAGRLRGAHPHRGAPAISGWPCWRPRWRWASSGRWWSGAASGRSTARPPLDQVLLTFGFIYLFEDLVKWIWGGRIRSIPPPELFSGSVTVLGRDGPVVPALRDRVRPRRWPSLLWLLIERTRLGAIIRAGVFDAEMTGGHGHQHRPRVHRGVRLRRRARRALRRHRGADPVGATRRWARRS